MNVVRAADTSVEPDAVVVHLRDTGFAKATVFAARGLSELAGVADGARVEDCAVVGIVTHLCQMIGVGNEGLSGVA